jgi:hypothetical protein
MNTTTRENFPRLIEAVKALPATPTAVAYPCDESALAGALEAAKLGIIETILVVSDLEGGNVLAKSLPFLADADSAGLMVGARVPITLSRPADSVQSRLASYAVAAEIAARRRELAVKVS